MVVSLSVRHQRLPLYVVTVASILLGACARPQDCSKRLDEMVRLLKSNGQIVGLGPWGNTAGQHWRKCEASFADGECAGAARTAEPREWPSLPGWDLHAEFVPGGSVLVSYTAAGKRYTRVLPAGESPLQTTWNFLEQAGSDASLWYFDLLWWQSGLDTENRRVFLWYEHPALALGRSAGRPLVDFGLQMLWRPSSPEAFAVARERAQDLGFHEWRGWHLPLAPLIGLDRWSAKAGPKVEYVELACSRAGAPEPNEAVPDRHLYCFQPSKPGSTPTACYRGELVCQYELLNEISHDLEREGPYSGCVPRARASCFRRGQRAHCYASEPLCQQRTLLYRRDGNRAEECAWSE